jgi:hypothetical protein
MTAKELKSLLKEVPDNALIVAPGLGNTYSKIFVEITTAIQLSNCLFEDCEGKLGPTEKRIPIVLVS